MDGVISLEDEDVMISQFLGIVAGQTTTTARYYLQVSGWDLEQALQLFFIQSEAWNSTPTYDYMGLDYQDPPHSKVEEEIIKKTCIWEKGASSDDGGDGGKTPAAHDGVAGIENNDGSSAIVDGSLGEMLEDNNVDSAERIEIPAASNDHDGTPLNNLASLFRPPLNLIFRGNFERAKDVAREQNRWLLVNVQSDRTFNSHLLNRDTWADETVAEIVGANFVFWQVYDDTERGQKVCSYYKIDSFPVLMVIDPITGQKKACWTGMIQPENLLEKLSPYMDVSPEDSLFSLANKLERALAISTEDLSIGQVGSQETAGVTKMPVYPPLPEEPKGDRSLFCRVGIRLPPHGRRIQRNFLLSDPIQLLWSFCFSELDEEDRAQPLQLTQAIPRGSKRLEYDSNLTFEESGLANSMISVTLG